jgi:hypothetical protein
MARAVTADASVLAIATGAYDGYLVSEAVSNTGDDACLVVVHVR